MVQELYEENTPDGARDTPTGRSLHDLDVGGLGMELGGSVWMLDRDKDGPWTLVKRKAPKKAESTSERQRKYALERERSERQRKYAPEREGPLFAVGREDGNMTSRKVTHKRKYEMITVTADSGAADHVAPKNVASHLQVQETAASRQGMKYVAANGQKISNEGQKTI